MADWLIELAVIWDWLWKLFHFSIFKETVIKFNKANWESFVRLTTQQECRSFNYPLIDSSGHKLTGFHDKSKSEAKVVFHVI